MSHRIRHMESHAMHIKGKHFSFLIILITFPIISVKYGHDSYRLQSLQFCINTVTSRARLQLFYGWWAAVAWSALPGGPRPELQRSR